VISRISGRLAAKRVDQVEIVTTGGLGYEIAIPLSAFESLPSAGAEVTLHTHLVVKEDAWQLFGFTSVYDRQVFRAVLAAKGVGPSLALGLLSTLSADRVVRAIRDRDVAALQTVPRVGRKKAEQLVLDLADKMDELLAESAAPGAPRGPGTEDAVLGLVRLGYPRSDAERAVRAALEATPGTPPVADLIRAALGKIGGR
jgi:Holliday junction DNA helicase RuvA